MRIEAQTQVDKVDPVLKWLFGFSLLGMSLYSLPMSLIAVSSAWLLYQFRIGLSASMGLIVLGLMGGLSVNGGSGSEFITSPWAIQTQLFEQLLVSLSSFITALQDIESVWMPCVWMGLLSAGLLLGFYEGRVVLTRYLVQVKNGIDQSEPARSTDNRTDVKEHQQGVQQKESGYHAATNHSGTLLGTQKSNNAPVWLMDQDANLHTLIVGTTGSGKTTALANIIESAIKREQMLIYVDGKGDLDLASRVEQYAKAQGRPFYRFSMIGDSVKYNPLATGGYTSKKDRIIELRDWSEDHYRKLAEGYLQMVFRILDRAGIDVDLANLAHYMDTDELYLLVRDIGDKTLADEINRQQQAEKDISSLRSEIQNFIGSEIGHLFQTAQTDESETLTLAKAFDEQAVVYFCLQPLAFPAYANTLGKLIINDLKAIASEQMGATEPNQEKSKIFAIFDEFSIFAGEQVINLINQGRSAGIHAFLSTQSLSDLGAVGGEHFTGRILNNCNNYIVQRQNNPDDAETLASVIGTQDSNQYTVQIGDQGFEGNGSLRPTKEFIVHPDQIKRLKQGEAFYINKQRFSVQSITIRKGAI